MSADTERATMVYRSLATIREAISLHTVATILLGVTAGYSLAALGTDTVVLPVIGVVSGPVIGAVGLALTAMVYQRIGCCESCGDNATGISSGCGCSGECGDHCSVDI